MAYQPDISRNLSEFMMGSSYSMTINSAKIRGYKQKLLQIYGVINKRITRGPATATALPWGYSAVKNCNLRVSNEVYPAW